MAVFCCLVLCAAAAAVAMRRCRGRGRRGRTSSNLESSSSSVNALFPPVRTSPFTLKRRETAEYDVPVDAAKVSGRLAHPKKDMDAAKVSGRLTFPKRDKSSSALNCIKMEDNLCYLAAFAQSGIPEEDVCHEYDVPGSEVTVLPCEYEMPIELSVQLEQNIPYDTMAVYDTMADGDVCNIYEEI